MDEILPLESSRLRQPEGLLACPRTHVAVVDTLRKFSTRGRLLDVGAGYGSLAKSALDLGFSVVAVDLDVPFPDSGVSWVRGSAVGELPFRDQAFDVVTCIEVIEHVEDQFRLVRELSRLVRPGGLLILSTPNILNLASRLRFLLSGTYSLFERPVSELSKNPAEDHIHPVSFFHLRYILVWAGFEEVSVVTDRVRSSALWLFLLTPFIAIATWLALRKEADPEQRRRNASILRSVLSPALLFGRTLIAVAAKGPSR